jgi:hypothetical protein
MTEIRMTFKDGRATFIYDDALAPFMAEGDFTPRRVSTVEPDPRGGWSADMTLADAPGVVLGPFPLRQQALDAEVQWLREHRGL